MMERKSPFPPGRTGNVLLEVLLLRQGGFETIFLEMPRYFAAVDAYRHGSRNWNVGFSTA